MHSLRTLRQASFLLLAMLCLAALPARAQEPSSFAIDVPPWFALSFLDFRYGTGVEP